MDTFEDAALRPLESSPIQQSLSPQVKKFGQLDLPANSRCLIDFLETLDRNPGIRGVRAQSFGQMHILSGARVLDVGCGIGTTVEEMGGLVGRDGVAEGIDISEAMIGEARRRAQSMPNVKFTVGSASTLPYPDQTFDAVRSERMLLHMPDRAQAVSEMMRVTKSGGRIVVTDVDFDCTAITGKGRALTRKMTSIAADACVHPTSGRDLPALLRRAGLRDITLDLAAVSTPHEFCVHATQGAVRAAAEAGKVTAGEVEEWYRGLAELDASGDFLQIWLIVTVSGTVI